MEWRSVSWKEKGSDLDELQGWLISEEKAELL